MTINLPERKPQYQHLKARIFAGFFIAVSASQLKNQKSINKSHLQHTKNSGEKDKISFTATSTSSTHTTTKPYTTGVSAG
ncbi:hypothetical protein BIA58_06315 [Salmonella enterica]|uniref:Uncharacterized protein n=1 Tax=Salmonella enterica TaxID=28901 RepID=A0A5V1PL39_SALER|nr:hypothetical protein [Salmonella enterica]ECC3858144.1 hypothetical protein [Salmonella enterica subsp. enterica]EBQ4601053.1 hypothetical protein [Salmonella enterica]EBT2270452.1 hypothetical protein [Salmonella enterica]EDT6848462.1 hypothetical protein [Salmonella enterica subsp. enterica]